MKAIHIQGSIPQTKSELMELPGVGEYVASSFLSFHAGQRSVIIDANVVRLITRMTGDEYDGETRRQRWLIDLADRLTPSRVYKDYNYGVLDLAMQVCKSNPSCNVCPVSKHCHYRNNSYR